VNTGDYSRLVWTRLKKPPGTTQKAVYGGKNQWRRGIKKLGKEKEAANFRQQN